MQPKNTGHGQNPFTGKMSISFIKKGQKIFRKKGFLAKKNIFFIFGRKPHFRKQLIDVINRHEKGIDIKKKGMEKSGG